MQVAAMGFADLLHQVSDLQRHIYLPEKKKQPKWYLQKKIGIALCVHLR